MRLLAVTGIPPETCEIIQIYVVLLQGLGAISCSAFKSLATHPESFWLPQVNATSPR